MPLNNNLKEQLKKIHTLITVHGTAFVNPRSPIVTALVTNKAISIAEAHRDPTDANKAAVSITAEGLAELDILDGPVYAPLPVQDDAPVPEAPLPVQNSPSRVRIVPTILTSGTRIKMPETKRGRGFGHRAETYPFGALQPPVAEGGEKLYDSFFVEKTDLNPNPTKFLAGTVSSAKKRYSLEGRKFSVVRVELDAEHGKEGARVLRTA